MDKNLRTLIAFLHATDRDHVRAQVREIALTYAFLEQGERPRISDLRREAHDVGKLSAELYRKLDSIHRATTRRLYFAVTPRIRLSGLRATLERLHESATRVVETLPSPGPADSRRVGITTLKQLLAAKCHDLFEIYRKGEATSTLDGDFRNFVNLTYEIATGDVADLETPIKHVLRIRKEGRKRKPSPIP